MLWFVAVTALLCFAVYLNVWSKSRPRIALPGPKGIPGLGNLLQVDFKAPHIKLTKWAQEYGGMFTLNMKGRNWVVVSTYDHIQEMLVRKGPEFANRPNSFRINYVSFNRNNVAFQNVGQNYYQIGKKVMHKSLKQYSVGLENIQDVVMVVLKTFKNKLEITHGKPYNPRITINNFVVQTLMSFLLGRFIEENDETFQMAREMSASNSIGLVVIGEGSELDAFPLLRYFKNKVYQRLTRGRELSSLIWGKYKGEVLEAAAQADMHSMMDILLAARHAQQTEVIKEINVQLLLTSTIVAGSATTFNTLSSFVNTMVHHPEVQRKLQKEVDEVVGSGRDVTLADRQNMPYTRATVLENNRYASIVPMGVAHATHADCKLAGVDVPKGTSMLTNFWALHHDEKFWGDPWEFRPERFLDEQGELVAADHDNRKHLMPFGAGSRMCIGEVFAMSRIFLFISAVLQHFTIRPAPGQMTSCDPRSFKPGLALVTPEFEACFEPRA